MAKQDILFRSKKKKAFELLDNNLLQESRVLLDQLCRVTSQDADVWCALGVIHGRLGSYGEAASCCQRAVTLTPRDVRAQYNLGVALRDVGQLEAAVDAFRVTLALEPAHRTAGQNLGHILLTLGRFEEAVAAFERALAVNPQNPKFLSDLGTALQLLGRYEASISCYRRSLQLAPELVPVYDNLASALTSQGRFQEALACYAEALRRDPKEAKVYSNYLLTLHYLPEISREHMLSEHKRWPGALQTPDAALRAPTDADLERRLKIGYVSADFRTHSVTYFFEPLLQARDRNAVEVYCYSAGQGADATTARLQALVDGWRDIGGMTDEQAAKQIRADGIDILVDLGGHTAKSRLGLFARKPAPIQVTYLGYPDTTGLTAVDYRVTDAWADPPSAEAYHTETLIRLDGCFLCYRPPEKAPEVAALPVLQQGFITFGSFNNLSKMNESVIKLWSRLLQQIPSARLYIKNHSLLCEATRARFLERFVAQGIAPERLELCGFVPGDREHLATYAHVDIALDTFPYNGTTTTCEALWMGVPVITLAGESHVERVGVSLLHAVGAEGLVARNQDEYIELAVNLAEDHVRLAERRVTLRQHMAVSPLCDAQAFSRKMETNYRAIWQTMIRQKH